MSGAAHRDTDPPPLSTVARLGGRIESRAFVLPPQPLTSFVGRERELRAVEDLLRDESVRLLTLTGPGGVGKTRVAMRLAEDLASVFDHGVAFVSLAAIADPDLVVGAIVQALGEREVSGQSRLDRLCVILRQRHLLLVLDNFEQIVAAAPAVARLLAECAGVKALVTSRVRLQISGEQEYALPPLGVPLVASTSIDDLDANPSVTLFVQRARSVRPNFALGEENAAAVAAVCRQLDGLPLAIELAAARSKVLAPSALRARLEHGLDLLSGGPRDQPERLRTLRAAIAWSYDLLAAEERTVFRRLAVFAGGFTLDAAEAVAAGDRGTGRGDDGKKQTTLLPSVLDSVAALVDSSLLREVEGFAREPRFGMLETIREFGLELLATSGEEDAVRAAHATWMLTLAENGDANTSLAPLGWLTMMESEHPNLRAALGWYVAKGDAVAAMRLAGAVWQFWHFRNHFREGESWLNQVLDMQGDGTDEVRGSALFGSGILAWARGDFDRARARHEEGLALARRRADVRGQGRALYGLGEIGRLQGAFAEAAAVYLDACDCFRVTGDLTWKMISLNGLGYVYHRQGDLDGALACVDEAIDLARQTGNTWGMAAVTVAAVVAHDRGEFSNAARYWAESLAIYAELRDWRAMAQIAAGVAALAVVLGEYEQAVRLFGASDAVRTTIGGGAMSTLRQWFQPRLEEAQVTLGAEAFARVWEAGRNLSAEETVRETAAVAKRLQRDDTPGPAVPAVRSPSNQTQFGLSPRELEVLRLLVAGQTDREIGATLFISPRTAQGHVAHLFDKLGVSTRTAAVTIALQNALVEVDRSE